MQTHRIMEWTPLQTFHIEINVKSNFQSNIIDYLPVAEIPYLQARYSSSGTKMTVPDNCEGHQELTKKESEVATVSLFLTVIIWPVLLGA